MRVDAPRLVLDAEAIRERAAAVGSSARITDDEKLHRIFDHCVDT